MSARTFRHHAALLLPLLVCASLSAQQPLHQRIDALVAEKTPDFDRLASPLADDAEFLRRITLDLTGTIPTAEQARAFLADKPADKRQKLIDTLLASPEHARHMSQVFDVMLMERRPSKTNLIAGWQEFLRTSLAANKPWDKLVREILSANDTDPKTRPAARFLLDRDGEPHAITRDVGRLFLGVDFQCAQCHDSPLVDDYKQNLYYGIFAFLNRTSTVTDAKLKLVVLSEKADGEVSYQSVFDPMKLTKTALPRVLDRPVVKDAVLEKGKEYVVKPDKTVRGVPAYSRRAKLGEEVARADSEAFRRNLANRLWAHLMGQGIIHPVDMSHSRNPPSYPELLKLLGDEAATHKFDMRWMLRELALSKAYQRSSLPPANGTPPPRSFAVANLKPLTPEVLAFSLYQATGNTDVERLALGKNVTEAALRQRITPAVAPLLATFTGEPGKPQQFEPTLDQALFFANSPVLKNWLAPRGSNLASRLAKLKDEQIAEEAYLSVLTRLPSEDERKDIAGYLKMPNRTRAAALQEIIWSLATSAEFRFNH
jgi:hypothetical protein